MRRHLGITLEPIRCDPLLPRNGRQPWEPGHPTSRSHTSSPGPARCDAPATCALLVDADQGYGYALSVRRTVEELETLGICAMSIEDTVLPRTYGSCDRPARARSKRT